MIQIGIQSELIELIAKGNKTVEGRLGKTKFLLLTVGDEIFIREDIYQHGKIISSIDNRLKIKIDSISRFNSFEQMLKEVGYKNAVPLAKDLYDAVAQYRTYYSKNDEKEYGVIAFQFHVVSS